MPCSAYSPYRIIPYSKASGNSITQIQMRRYLMISLLLLSTA